jgi:hypothetical protein
MTTNMDRLLREAEQARLIGISTRTLRAWRYDGLVPYIRLRKAVLYDPVMVRKALSKFERKEVA